MRLLIVCGAQWRPSAVSDLLRRCGGAFAPDDRVGYVLASVALIVAALAMRESHRQFAARIDEHGIMRSRSGRAVRFSWPDVVRVGFERPSSAARLSRPTVLTVWVAGADSDPDVEPDVFLDGLAGYRIVDVGDVRQSRAEITAALRRYAQPCCPEATA